MSLYFYLNFLFFIFENFIENFEVRRGSVLTHVYVRTVPTVSVIVNVMFNSSRCSSYPFIRFITLFYIYTIHCKLITLITKLAFITISIFRTYKSNIKLKLDIVQNDKSK